MPSYQDSNDQNQDNDDDGNQDKYDDDEDNNTDNDNDEHLTEADIPSMFDSMGQLHSLLHLTKMIIAIIIMMTIIIIAIERIVRSPDYSSNIVFL